MKFEESQTKKNLLAAFSGESMARNKYLFFAEKARQEGNDEVADLFERMAKNEGIHGKLLYQQLEGVGSSAANLQEAIMGEYTEWSNLYPSFAKMAREEGFEEVGVLFDKISKIEKDHEFRFLEALTKLNTGKSASAQPAASAAAPKKEIPAAPRTVTAQGYRCIFCGAIFDERPDVCDVCEAIGSFEPVTYQKQVD